MMSPDSTTLHRLVAEYETVLNPTASSEARRASEQYCEEIKCSGLRAIVLGTTLLDARNGHPLHLRNLGLNMIDHVVRCGLDSLSTVEQVQVRCVFWRLVMEEPGVLQCEGRLVLEKTASILAVLGCRMWLLPDDDPLQWNDYFTEALMSVLTRDANPSQRHELVLLAITQLIDTVRSGTVPEDGQPSRKTLSWLTEQRRLQLHAGLEITLPDLIKWILFSFPATAQHLHAVSDNRNVILAILSAEIVCFQSVCTWLNKLDPQELCRLVHCCLQLLLLLSSGNGAEETLATHISDMLVLLVTRRQFSPAETLLVESLLDTSATGGFPLLMQLLSQLSVQTDDPDCYQRLKATVQIVTTLGTRFVCHKKTPIIPKHPAAFLSVLVALCDTDCLTILLDTLHFWTLLLRTPFTLDRLGRDNVALAAPQLYGILLKRLSGSQSDSRIHPFNQIDFDDPVEFGEFWRLAVDRVCETMRLLATQFPVPLLEHSCAALSALSASHGKREWTAQLMAIEQIVRGVPVDGSSGPQPHTRGASSASTAPLIHHLLHLLTTHLPPHQDAAVLQRWIAAVRCAATAAGDACPPAVFSQTIHLLFTLSMQFCGHDATALRGTACAAILRLADATPRSFLPLLEPLLATIAPLVQNPASGARERTLFSELMLILLTQEQLPAHQQLAIFEQVIGPIMTLLRDGLQGKIISADDICIPLMEETGFALLRGQTELSAVLDATQCAAPRKMRADTSLFLGLLHALFRRIGSLVCTQPAHPVAVAFSHILDELVAGVMTLTESLQRLGSNRTWTRFMRSDYDYKTNMDDVVPETRLFYHLVLSTSREDGSAGDDSSSDSTGSSDCRTLCHQLAGWIRHCRTQCYAIMGLISTVGPTYYALFRLSDRILNLLTSDLDTLPLNDCATLVRLFIRPTLFNCPAALIPDFVKSMLFQLFFVFGQRIPAEWRAVTSSNAAGGDALAREIDHEASLVAISLALISLLHDLVVASGDKSSNEPFVLSLTTALEQGDASFESVPAETPAADCILQPPSGDMCPPLRDNYSPELGKFLLGAMQWPRPPSIFPKLAAVLVRLLSACMRYPTLPSRAKETLLEDIVRAALAAYRLPHWADAQSSLVVLLTEAYKWSFVLALETARAKGGAYRRGGLKRILQESRQLPIYFDQIVLEMANGQPVAGALTTLRQTLLFDVTVRGQRTTMRTFITTVCATPIVREPVNVRQVEVSARLADMKRRIARSDAADDALDNDGLSSLFAEGQ